MNRNAQQSLLVDIKDLLLIFLRKIAIILFVGLIFSGLLFGYKMFSIIKRAKASESEIYSVFDITEKLNGETDVEYSERVLNVNRAHDLVNSINAIKNQIENHRKYVSESIYMNINAENEAVTTASIIISVDTSMTNSVDIALGNSYKQYIQTGEFLSETSMDLDVNQGYLLELISVDYVDSSIGVYSSNNNGDLGVLNIKVIGPTTELTDKIMDTIIVSIENKSIDFKESINKHNITIGSRQCSYIVDNTTRDRQLNTTNRFESLQQQISNFDKSLDTISTNLGVSKSRIYEYFSFNEQYSEESDFSYFNAIKYCVIGFVLGVLLVLLIITVDYIFNNKFYTQAKFFLRFSSVNKLGVVKPSWKCSNFVKHINIFSGDDNKFSNETNYAIIAANIKNLTINMDKVLLTGTADYSKVNQLVKDLGVNVDVKKSFFDDPMCLETISEYDGVIIVEQRNYSNCRLIFDELNLIANSKTELIGAILL